jgi:nicotinamide mononucleotide (NMN) deamidase PncC
MNITQKATLLKVNLNWLIDHDDVPEEQVKSAIDDLKKHMDAQWDAAKKRRAAAAKAKALPQ